MKKSLRKRRKRDFSTPILAVITIVGVGLILAFFIGRFIQNNPFPQTSYESEIQKKPEEKGCIKSISYRLPDTNLATLFENKKVNLLFNYYNCNPVKRADTIVYSYALGPVTQIVRGIPYDQIRIEKAEVGSQIFVNDKLLTTSKGTPYVITKPNLLTLYVENYRGMLPKDTYLILPDYPNLERTFGFVDSVDFVGKLVE